MSGEKTSGNRILAFLKAEWLLVVVAGLYAWAAIASPERALRAVAVGADSLWFVFPIILSVFATLGLFAVFVDKKKIAAKLGHGSGLLGLLVAAALGTVIIGPVFAVFPLLQAIRAHGARWGVIATTLTAWAIKLPMIPLEAGFLGWRFSAVRIALTLVAAVAMGLLMEALMPRDDAEVAEAADAA